MITTPKGIHDLLPSELATWQHVEATARDWFAQNHVQEIRTPILEYTELFARGVGESTDIVNKEMFSFEKEGRPLTLRPENTAGVVRAYCQHGMDRWPKPVKLYYMGPMFRYERPQAGRQRQFHQVGVEIFGLDTPLADLHAIVLAHTFLHRLGIEGLSLEINNVGCATCREAFKDALRALLEKDLPTLCQDCQRRAVQNPMRMLDCKNPGCQARYAQPDVSDFLARDNTCEVCQAHFQAVLEGLAALAIPARKNRMLVRGLDYYTGTVFEITAAHLGAQNALCGGGRYNGLVRMLGGPDTPAVGWAMGMERLVSLMTTIPALPLQYFVVSDNPVTGLAWVQTLQQHGISAELDLSGKPMGKQIGLADKRGAQRVLILGADERASDQVTVKSLAEGSQETLSQTVFLARLTSR